MSIYSRLELVIVMMALIVGISDQVVHVSNSSSYHHNGYGKDCRNEPKGLGLSIRMCTLHVIYYILEYVHQFKSDECITVTYIYVRCGRVQDTTHI